MRLLSQPHWPPWTAPVALFGGLLLAAVGGLCSTSPRRRCSATKITSSHLPPGLSIADTVVQDIGFVLVGGVSRAARRADRALVAVRAAPSRCRLAVGGRPGPALLIAFILISASGAAMVHPSKEKTLEQLGSNEGTALLVLSAA